MLSIRSVLCAIVVAILTNASSGADRPNILWITCEDMSPDIGCYGGTAHTPRLDRLAQEGVLFTNAFAVAPVCSPSRSGLITGHYPTQIGTMHHRSNVKLPAGVRCFPEYLREAGYYCSNNVKTDYNFKPPASTWDDSSNKAHWRNRKPGQPFFSVFNFTTTHESHFHQPEKKFVEEMGSAALATSGSADKRPLPPYYPDTPAVREDWRRYHAMMAAMDEKVADVLRQLDEDGLSSNTIVFYFSDHGVGLPRGKRWLYDSGLRVPLIVRWPGQVAAATTNKELVSLLDMAPTVLAMAGLPVPENMVGRVIAGPAKKPAPEYLFAARDRMDETSDTSRAVMDGTFKYITNLEPQKPYSQVVEYAERAPTMKELRRLKQEDNLTTAQALFMAGHKPAEELYDTAADPHEVNNLAADPAQAQRLEKMRGALKAWQKKFGDLGLVPEQELMEKIGDGDKKPGRRAGRRDRPVPESP